MSIRGDADASLIDVSGKQRENRLGAGRPLFLWLGPDLAGEFLYISALHITDLRVISDLEIHPKPGINFVVGDNGAGKTSVLESIYLAGRGRSFRHAEAGPLIRKDCEEARVVLRVRYERDGKESVLGVARTRNSLRCRLDGEDVVKRSMLAEALPVQFIGSQPQQFLGLGPEIRRRFVDMGVFHVEHAYLQIIGEFQKILKQRNAALRSGNLEAVRVWDEPFHRAAEQVNFQRAVFIDRLMEKVLAALSAWDVGYTLDYRYRRGWAKGRDLLAELREKLDSDLKMRFTHVGPQRGELSLIADGDIAEKKLSRGQQKVLVLAINLALIDLVNESRGYSPVLLIDDLAAELDGRHRDLVVSELEKRETQVFLTQIQPDALPEPANSSSRFHVEHGSLK